MQFLRCYFWEFGLWSTNNPAIDIVSLFPLIIHFKLQSADVDTSLLEQQNINQIEHAENKIEFQTRKCDHKIINTVQIANFNNKTLIIECLYFLQDWECLKLLKLTL